MSSSAFLIGGVLPYFALAIFATGAVFRLVTWRRVPQPGLMTLYPTHGASFLSLTKEALFFPGLFRADRTLWFFAWSFHVALVLAFVGHLRIATGAIDRGLALVGIGARGAASLSSVAGGFAGAVLLATLLLLLGRRILVARVRQISSVPDFFALFLLVAVVTTGNVMRFFGTRFDLAETRAWSFSLLAFAPAVPANPAFLLHLLCAELLTLHIAFSKLMHFGGLFFTFSLIKRSEP